MITLVSKKVKLLSAGFGAARLSKGKPVELSMSRLASCSSARVMSRDPESAIWLYRMKNPGELVFTKDRSAARLVARPA